MKRMLIGLMLSLTLSWVVGLSALEAATPPAIVNYQGVLLDAGGGPENGDRDIVFHFYDSAVAGNEILRDKHLFADGKQVSVMTGLFNVPIGTGVIEDGAGVFPNDPYDTLDKVFRDFPAVYLEVEVRVGPAGGGGAFETLSPRTRVFSSPYALNAMDAGSLGGMSAGSFINTSAAAQIKAGDLTVADLVLNGNDLRFGNGAQASNQPGYLLLSGGTTDASDLILNAGNSSEDGSILLQGQGPIYFRPGNGEYQFLAASGGQLASLDTTKLKINTDLTVGGFNLKFDSFGNSGPSLFGVPTGLTVTAGLEDTDNIVLNAGNSSDDGRLALFGDGAMELRAGSGLFSFVNGNTAVETAILDASGNLQIDGGLTAGGDLVLSQDLHVGGGIFPNGTPSLFMMLDPNSASTTAKLSVYTNGSVVNDILQIEEGGELKVLSLGIGNPNTSSTDPQPATINMVGFLFDNLETRSKETMQTIIDSDNNSTVETATWCTNGNCSGANRLMRLEAATGNLLVNGSVVPNSFDLAEIYLKGEDLEPGDVVRIDPRGRNAVVRSSGAGDQTVLGIVSAKPGVILGGMPTGVNSLEPVWGPQVRDRFLAEKDGLVRSILKAEPSRDVALSRLQSSVAESAEEAGPEPRSEQTQRDLTSLQDDLEFEALQAFYAQHFAPVALAGRVPVKVDTQYGAITAGDALAPSPIPGVAMKDDGQGPVIGIALESFSGGRGKVEAFIARGGASPEIIGQTRALAESVEQRTPDPDTGVQALSGHLQIVLDKDADDEARLSVFRDGEDEESASEVFRVDEDGNVFAKGSFRPNSMDVAELFALSERAEPGDVLAADPDRPGRFRPARDESDATVIGVVASQPGMLLGSGVDRILAADASLAARLEEARRANDRQAEAKTWRQLESSFAATHAAVAMTGTVSVKADAGYGVIRTGDLLCSSPTAGHAMRSDDALPGTIIGKALEPLESGTGLVKILVMMR